MNYLTILLATLGLFLSGCQPRPESGVAVGTPNASPTTTIEVDEPDVAIIIPTPALQTTPDPTPELFPVPLFTPTYPVPTPLTIAPTAMSQNTEYIDSGVGGYVCDRPPTLIDSRETFDFAGIVDMYFIDENKLRVEGIVNRESIITTPISPTIPLEERGDQAVSADIAWQTVEFNLRINEGEVLKPAFAPLIQNPCPDGNCSLNIVSQSPNKQWQLVQVYRGSSESGYWLVSQDTVLQLIGYVPYSFHWIWSMDSSMFWFAYSKPVFGAHSYITFLEGNSPVVFEMDEDEQSPLAVTYNYLVFSPIENRLLSLARLRYAESVPELYSFEFAQNVIEGPTVEQIPNLIKIEWDEGIQSILKIYQDGDNIRITSYDDSMSLLLLLDLFELSDEVMEHNVPLSLHAVSPSFQQFATTLGDGRIFVFDCP